MLPRRLPSRPDKKAVRRLPTRPDARAGTGRRLERCLYCVFRGDCLCPGGEGVLPVTGNTLASNWFRGSPILGERQLACWKTGAGGARTARARAFEIDSKLTRLRVRRLAGNCLRIPPARRRKKGGLDSPVCPRLNPKPGTRDFRLPGHHAGAPTKRWGRQFGVTIAFRRRFGADRGLNGFRAAPNVDFETALLVSVAPNGGTFTRVVDEHTLFVTDDNAQEGAGNTPSKIEKKVLLLPASITSDEMNETVSHDSAKMTGDHEGRNSIQLRALSRVRSNGGETSRLAQASRGNKLSSPHGDLIARN